MKTKDLISLGVLAVVLIVIGTFLVGKISGAKQRTAEVEIITPISPEFDGAAQAVLLGRDTSRPAEIFSAPINLEQGFGNNNPFRGE